MLNKFWRWLLKGFKFGKCCEYSAQLASIHEELVLMVKQGETIMADLTAVKAKIAEVKEAALAQLVALDEKVEAIYKLVNDEADTTEVIAELDSLKTDLSAAIEKAGTDDPDV